MPDSNYRSPRFPFPRFPILRGVIVGVVVLVLVVLVSILLRSFWYFEVIENDEVGVAIEAGEIQRIVKPGIAYDLGLFVTELGGRLGVSRTPLREALLHLESQGFVTVLPRRGFRLNALTLDDIRHFYEIIGALEAAALRSVGPRLGSADFTRMRALDASMAGAVAARDFDRYYEANLAFHDVYLGRSDNARLVTHVHLLKQRYDWPRRETMVQAWEQHSVVEHENFLGLLERGAVDEAAVHLQDVYWSFAVGSTTSPSPATASKTPPRPRRRASQTGLFISQRIGFGSFAC